MRKALGTFAALLLISVPSLDLHAQPRQALWAVIRACVLADDALGSPIPCQKRDYENGYSAMILDPPFGQTHLLVVPAVRVPGIESPALGGSSGGAYAQMAWRNALQLVSGAWDRAAFVVNSSQVRSQDQLHIHVDCLSAQGRRARDRLAHAATSHWTKIGRDWIMLLDNGDLARENPFRLVRKIPGVQIAELNLAAMGTGRGPRDQQILLLANSSHSYEWMLQSKCQG